MSACKCSLFGRDQKRTISSGRALAILCELAADHRSFSRFCFLFELQSAEIIDKYYVDNSSIILDIIGKNSASRLVDGSDAEYEPPSDPNWETSGGNDFQLLA